MPDRYPSKPNGVSRKISKEDAVKLIENNEENFKTLKAGLTFRHIEMCQLGENSYGIISRRLTLLEFNKTTRELLYKVDVLNKICNIVLQQY